MSKTNLLFTPSAEGHPADNLPFTTWELIQRDRDDEWRRCAAAAIRHIMSKPLLAFDRDKEEV